jgi:hypothetical protein
MWKSTSFRPQLPCPVAKLSAQWTPHGALAARHPPETISSETHHARPAWRQPRSLSTDSPPSFPRDTARPAQLVRAVAVQPGRYPPQGLPRRSHPRPARRTPLARRLRSTPPLRQTVSAAWHRRCRRHCSRLRVRAGASRAGRVRRAGPTPAGAGPRPAPGTLPESGATGPGAVRRP